MSALKMPGTGVHVGTMLRGSFSAFCIRAAGVVLCYGLHVVLAKWMGLEQYGIYACALAWLAVAAMPARLGFDTGLLRLLAAYAERSEHGLMKGLLRRAAQLGAATGALIAAVGAAVVGLALGGHMPEGLRQALLAGAALVPLLAILVLWQSSIQSQRRILWAYIPDQIVRPLGVAAVAAPLYAAGYALTAARVVTVEVLAAVVSVGAAAWLLRRALPDGLRVAQAEYRTRQWLRTCLPMLLIGGLSFLLGQVDILMVSLLIDTTQAGIYAAAVKSAVLLSFALVAVNAILAPMISVLHASGQVDELQRVVSAASRMIIYLTLLPAVGFVVFAGLILRMFGPEFVVGRWALVILVAGQVVNAAAGSVSLLLTMTGHESDCARVVSRSAVVNIALNAIGIPLLGLEGAAVSTAVTLVMQNLWLMRLVQRRVGVRSTVLIRPRR